MSFCGIKNLGESFGAWSWLGGLITFIVVSFKALFRIFPSSAELLSVRLIPVVGDEEIVGYPDIKTFCLKAEKDLSESFYEQAKDISKDADIANLIMNGTRVILGFEIKTKKTAFLQYSLNCNLKKQQKIWLKGFYKKLTVGERRIIKNRIKKTNAIKDTLQVIDNNAVLSRIFSLNIGPIFTIKDFTLSITLFDMNGRKAKKIPYRYILSDDLDDVDNSKVLEILNKLKVRG